MNIRCKRILYVALSFCISTISDTAIVVKGNVQGPTSFTFSIGPHARTAPGGTFYVGALKSGVAGAFAIARTFEGQDFFEPFALETATINCMPNQPNPLYNAGIAQLSTFAVAQSGQGLNGNLFFPMAVTVDRPADLFLVNDKLGTDRLFMLALSNIKDATSQVTREIIGLQSFFNEAIFAAVKPSNSDDFGQPGSGIAVVQVISIKVDNQQQTALAQINADPTSLDPITIPIASPLDVSSDSLKIGDDLVSIANTIDMYFNSRLKRLYVALQVQGGPNADDGARAIAVGRLENQKLIFSKIAPDAVMTDANKIVGGTGSNSAISIQKVRTMFTSTSLDYLVVVGGNGAPDDTQMMVYALPLVDTSLTGSLDEQVQGTLANVLVDPQDFYTKNTQDACELNPQVFVGRSFIVPALEPDQVYTNTQKQAMVGGGPLPFGNITDINVAYDAVFVSVADAINNEQPGIFYSQALFAQNGTIASWTPWQRVAGTTDKVFGVSYESSLGDFLWLTGQTDQQIKTVKRTVWGKGDPQGLGNMVAVVQALLPQPCAGVQGFFNLPSNTPGLFDISLFIATGLGQVVLIESGEVTNNVLYPNTGDFQTDLQQFTDGTITENFPVGVARIVSIQGGALSNIGPIIAATLAVKETTQQGYVCVGGAYGLAALAQANGDGWSTTNGLGKQFAGLVTGMRFITLGDYCFVRKLIYDAGFLYVLTDTQLDRIDVAATDFSTGIVSAVTVATLSDIDKPGDGALLDMAISGSFALLGSSTGLYRVGDGADIQTATNAQEVLWTPVDIPEGISVAQFLQPIASSAAPNSFATQGTSNVYLTDAYRGFDTAQLNRYCVVSAAQITDNTIQPLPDMHIKNILTAFRNFNNFRSMALYDGADLFSSRDRVQLSPPFVFNRNIVLPLGIADASTVTSIVRSSASGAWLIAGDFGLRVNE